MISNAESIYPSVAYRPHKAYAQSGALLQLRRRLVRATQKVCPAWLASQVEDITQDVLIRLADDSRQDEVRQGFSSSYLNKAAYNATVDAVRRHQRHRQGESLATDTASPDVSPGPAHDPEKVVILAEVIDEVQRCLERMVRPRGIAVKLYLLGHTVPEISRMTGWSEAKATNLVYRGLQSMRRWLRAKGLTPS